jgi:hypothetical protein
MFKLPGTPSSRAHPHELADYAEWVCWRDNGTSQTALSQDLGRLDENDYTGGVPEEEEIPRIVGEAFKEIERRNTACRNGYPFALGRKGYTLLTDQEGESHKHIIYKYLLLATRLNMKDNRSHSGIDGAGLFEELAAEATRSYFGSRSESHVFGTSAEDSNFAAKVDELCQLIQEGIRFETKNQAPPLEKDGKLDVVVWIPFPDGMPGKLIAFGQCKTGTDYKDKLTQLQPDSFCNSWFYSSPVLTPLRMFFVAEALPQDHWYSTASNAGLLFDRSRIVDCCDDLSADVLAKVATWTKAAAASLRADD